MPKYQATGAIRHIHDTQTFASGFAKREFVIEIPDGKYPQLIKFELVKDKCSHLDKLTLGDVVEVSFDIRGSEYKDRFYVNLVAWKVEATGERSEPPRDRTPADSYKQPRTPAHSSNQGSDYPDDDDIPFAPVQNITHF